MQGRSFLTLDQGDIFKLTVDIQRNKDRKAMAILISTAELTIETALNGQQNVIESCLYKRNKKDKTIASKKDNPLRTTGINP